MQKNTFSCGVLNLQVCYAGQALGLIVADSTELAQRAARMVKVTYKNAEKPIVDIKEAVKDEKRRDETTMKRVQLGAG